MTHERPYGIAAEFEDADRLLAAARAAHQAGYRRLEAYSPYPLKELDEIIPARNLLPPVVFAAGVLGIFTAFYLRYFIAAIVYPPNIGRPLNNWPAFVPILFELTLLFAASAAFFGTLFCSGFPALYHPLFQIPSFRRVSDDGFFLCIEARDRRFHATETARFLQSLEPLSVWEVDLE